MKKLFVFALMFCFVTLQYAQTITGKLVDQNGSGLAGLQLKLYISLRTYDATSGSDGSFTFNNITDVKENELPSGYSISENYPNPFNPKTRVGITLPNSGKAKIDIYNVLGQKVSETINKALNTGTNYLDIELAGLPNGIYLAHITLDDKYTMIKKLMLMYGSQHLASSQNIPNFSFKKTALATILDSLIVTGASISKTIFKSLPSMVGNTLNLGSLTVTLPPPTAPTLLAPTNLSLDQSITPTLSWNAVSRATSYTLHVSTNSTFNTFVYNQSNLTSTSQQLSGLSNLTTYYWRIAAANKYGSSSYSNTWSFATIGSAPSQPTLSLPNDGANDQITDLILSWNAVAGAASYTLQVSANNDFSSFVYNQSEITSTSKQITGLANSTKYYWRVNATNKYGISSYSSIRSFTTGTPPSIPTLATPADLATEIPLTTTLYWNVSSGATSYTLQVSTNSQFSSYVINQSGLTNTNKQISGLSYFTKYYWRVRGAKGSFNSDWSQVWSFNTAGTTPQVPTLISPTNVSTNISTSPILSWNQGLYASSYTLQVSSNSSFTSFVYNQSGITSTSQQINGINNSTTYYWRVQSQNGNGNSGWSIINSFTTIITIPLTPTLSSPINRSGDISLSPTLYWNVNSATTSYTLQVSTDTSFSSYIFNQSGLINTNQQIGALTNTTQYFWRVSSTNSYGASSWSKSWSFQTIVSPCPEISSVLYAGKTYGTVKIGDQCWLKENLNVGTMISDSQNQSNNSVIEKYCYNNDPNNCNVYGGLYTWDEAMQYVTNQGAKGICPDGWHIPTLAEFQTLKNSVNDPNKLKSISQGSGSMTGSNTSGFSALLAGARSSLLFFGIEKETAFWSSVESATINATTFYLYNSMNILFMNYGKDSSSWSVRCIKD